MSQGIAVPCMLVPFTRSSLIYLLFDCCSSMVLGRPHVVDLLKDGHVQLLMNTTEGAQAVEDSKDMRSVALYGKIPYFTTAAGSNAAALAIKAQAEGDVTVKSLQG